MPTVLPINITQMTCELHFEQKQDRAEHPADSACIEKREQQPEAVVIFIVRTSQWKLTLNRNSYLNSMIVFLDFYLPRSGSRSMQCAFAYQRCFRDESEWESSLLKGVASISKRALICQLGIRPVRQDSQSKICRPNMANGVSRQKDGEKMRINYLIRFSNVTKSSCINTT